MSEDLTSQAEMPEEEPVKAENFREETEPQKRQSVKDWLCSHKSHAIIGGGALTAVGGVYDLKTNGMQPTTPLISTLLNEAGKPAPKMTQDLSALGGSNMANGFNVLWEDGRKAGFHIVLGGTAMALGAAAIMYGAYIIRKSIIAKREAKQNAYIAASAGKQPMGIKEESE
jgi:hypothetical protein